MARAGSIAIRARVVLLGLVPESMELAVGLSPRVRPALPALVERVVDEARALGFAFRRKSADETPARWSDC